MRGTEYIALSTPLIGMGTAGIRSATSRAYYGAFHCTLELLLEIGVKVPKNGKSHNHAHSCLQKGTDAETLKASRLLGDLHSRRLKADYTMSDLDCETGAYGALSTGMAVEVSQCLDSFRARCRANPALVIDLLDKMAEYCRVNGIEIMGASRSQ